MNPTERSGQIIGLTGQTGAGKSTVSDLLKGRDFAVIDADLVSRQVVGKGGKCLLDLAAEFGSGILNIDGTLNRRRLADIAFHDEDKRDLLNRITHPYIIDEIKNQADSLLKSGKPVVFLDAPTLFESGGDSLCDRIVSVIAPADQRKTRIKSRDFLTDNEADARINAQYGDEFYIDRSDFVIENGSDISTLRVLVMEMLARFDIA